MHYIIPNCKLLSSCLPEVTVQKKWHGYIPLLEQIEIEWCLFNKILALTAHGSNVMVFNSSSLPVWIKTGPAVRVENIGKIWEI